LNILSSIEVAGGLYTQNRTPEIVVYHTYCNTLLDVVDVHMTVHNVHILTLHKTVYMHSTQ